MLRNIYKLSFKYLILYLFIYCYIVIRCLCCFIIIINVSFWVKFLLRLL